MSTIKTDLICSTQGCEKESARQGCCLHHHMEELYEALEWALNYTSHKHWCEWWEPGRWDNGVVRDGEEPEGEKFACNCRFTEDNQLVNAVHLANEH